MTTPDAKRSPAPGGLDRTVIDLEGAPEEPPARSARIDLKGAPEEPRATRAQRGPERPVAVAVEPGTDLVRLEPGLHIERYELIRELGRGGMGRVFLARDSRLGRRVAIKFLATNSPRFTARFLVEARATARCSHEHIVVIHEVDEYRGLPYMVLEYVEGISLGQLIADKRLPVARAIELIVPVVKALGHAHAATIVHRDLKPENIVVTAAGTVKVLDFGIAKLFATPEVGVDPPSGRSGAPLGATRAGAVVGTLPYMSPEQLGADEVDHRSDLWAVGVILYEMVAGRHPLHPLTEGRLYGAAAALDQPMPSLGDEVAGLPDRLVAIVGRCLAKPRRDRYPTAAELCADLEALLPSRAGRKLAADESPYPGLTAFQESDANRFFGRAQDVAAIVARLRDRPMVAVAGPSGVGKSSVVRAGVVPALKSSGDAWDAVIVRPGRYPLAALASMLESLRETRDREPVVAGDDLASLLRREPGTLGARLRARARSRRTQILVFVDQHEELYTLVADAAERTAFTACLAGAGDDPSGPLRVVVAMRSDFLDRAAEDRRFVDELTRGLVFLQPPSRDGLEHALVQPLEMLGYGFEPGIVPEMLDTLEATRGSLPLLQFTAARLWETRDKQRQVLARSSYAAMGGVAGALASHADAVLATFAQPDQAIVRKIVQRLVTPERTRALVDASDLRDVSPDVERIIGLLVGARLLVCQTRGSVDGAAVEIVHESLITSWPTLRRWLDENQDDAAYLALVHAAAKQWDAKGRLPGLLWRGEAMAEARLWRSRYPGELPARDRDFVDAVIALGTRAARIKRRLVIGAFAFLLVLIAAGSAALWRIRDARQTALDNEAKALDNAANAQRAAGEARLAKQIAERATEQARRDQQIAETRTREAQDANARLEAETAAGKRKDHQISAASAQVAKLEEARARAAAERARLASEKARLEAQDRARTGARGKVTKALP